MRSTDFDTSDLFHRRTFRHAWPGLYGVVSVPPSVVEPLIAVSIVFIAVENFLTDRLTPWRPYLVFGFGLIHGLGFAGVLHEVGLARDDFINGLIAFNVGVEFGQLAVIALAFLVTGLVRRGIEPGSCNRHPSSSVSSVLSGCSNVIAQATITATHIGQ